MTETNSDSTIGLHLIFLPSFCLLCFVKITVLWQGAQIVVYKVGPKNPISKRIGEDEDEKGSGVFKEETLLSN